MDKYTKIIIQARVGSKRFPKKILKKIDSRNIIEFLIERLLKKVKKENIIIATTLNKKDNSLLYIKKKYNINLFRGSENNVLKRYIDCASKFKVKNIIRITSDCPLIDTKILDKMLKNFKKNKYDYYSNNCILCSKKYADGLDIEIFTLNSLKKVNKISKNKSDYEHVTNIYWKKKDFFKIGFHQPRNDQKNFRFSVDYKSDLIAVKKIIFKLKKRKLQLNSKNILFILRHEKKIKKIFDKNLEKFKENRPDLKI